MTTADLDTTRFDISRVISQTLAVLRRNVASFGILGLILVGLPTALVGIVQFTWLHGAMPGLVRGVFDISPDVIVGSSFGGLVLLITTFILQGALIHGTVLDLDGQPQSTTESLATGLRNFLPLFVVTLLFFLAVGFGMVLFVVPGVMIACAWCVAAPALVAERTGIFGAFSRSADLTRGNRWQIFALILIVVVFNWAVDKIFQTAMGLGAFPYLGDPVGAVRAILNPITALVIALGKTIGSVVGATAIAVMYVELRRSREGEPTAWLSDIFR
jgi:hypothetical protein